MFQYDHQYGSVFIKQYLSNIWGSIHEKVKQHWGWVEKNSLLVKKRVLQKLASNNLYGLDILEIWLKAILFHQINLDLILMIFISYFKLRIKYLIGYISWEKLLKFLRVTEIYIFLQILCSHLKFCFQIFVLHLCQKLFYALLYERRWIFM